MIMIPPEVAYEEELRFRSFVIGFLTGIFGGFVVVIVGQMWGLL